MGDPGMTSAGADVSSSVHSQLSAIFTWATDEHHNNLSSRLGEGASIAISTQQGHVS